ncbi:hypothetical protein GCM10023238_38760 [Streptomyces heliomycini]
MVGLSGLPAPSEIADLVAVCEVLQDPGANASLVRLLTGPRWRIGPRDLALLGRRARRLVSHARVDGDDDPDRRLAEAVEVSTGRGDISLADALDTFLETPLDGRGDDDGRAFSPDARVRFARPGHRTARLRRCLADPLMDVLHRVLAVTAWRSNSPRPRTPWAAPPARDPLQLPRRRRVLRRRRRRGHLCSPSSASCAPPPSTRRASTTRCPAARTPSGPHRAQVQGPRMTSSPSPTGHRHLPQQPGREKWTAQGKVLPHRLRGDADTLPDVESWDSRGLKPSTRP